uniref:Uncharacterized protein n=1 Tax=Triticum urartu TaxID=4572 RepID=A0A8R7P4A0_TRIUA
SSSTTTATAWACCQLRPARTSTTTGFDSYTNVIKKSFTLKVRVMIVRRSKLNNRRNLPIW